MDDLAPPCVVAHAQAAFHDACRELHRIGANLASNGRADPWLDQSNYGSYPYLEMRLDPTEHPIVATKNDAAYGDGNVSMESAHAWLPTRAVIHHLHSALTLAAPAATDDIQRFCIFLFSPPERTGWQAFERSLFGYRFQSRSQNAARLNAVEADLAARLSILHQARATASPKPFAVAIPYTQTIDVVHAASAQDAVLMAAARSPDLQRAATLLINPTHVWETPTTVPPIGFPFP